MYEIPSPRIEANVYCFRYQKIHSVRLKRAGFATKADIIILPTGERVFPWFITRWKAQNRGTASRTLNPWEGILARILERHKMLNEPRETAYTECFKLGDLRDQLDVEKKLFQWYGWCISALILRTFIRWMHSDGNFHFQMESTILLFFSFPSSTLLHTCVLIGFFLEVFESIWMIVCASICLIVINFLRCT